MVRPPGLVVLVVGPLLVATHAFGLNGWTTIALLGTCDHCETSVASSADAFYGLGPPDQDPLTAPNHIFKSPEWNAVYPPDESIEWGTEGDIIAFNHDVVYIGHVYRYGPGVAAFSRDEGATWGKTLIALPPIELGNLYLYPHSLGGTSPYALAGWYWLGEVAIFSFDGGVSWTAPATLPGAREGGNPPPCAITALDPVEREDLRVPDLAFARMKAGRHGGWGTDGLFYWSAPDPTNAKFYVCFSEDYGLTWNGWRHDLPGDALNNYVSVLGLDSKLGQPA